MAICLKRFAAVLAAGVVVGVLVGAGSFGYVWKYRPRYTAVIPFYIKPPDQASSNAGVNLAFVNDDSERLIRQQMRLFDQEAFLMEVLKDEEFRRDPKNADPKFTTPWIMEHGHDPQQLKEDLRIVPYFASATFELHMTCADPAEAQKNVQAAARVYLQFLQTTASQQKSAKLAGLRKSLEMETANYQNMASLVKQYAQSKQIDVLRTKIDVEKLALQELNTRFAEASAISEASNAQYSAIRAMRAEAEANHVGMKLSPEMEEAISRDATLVQLSNQRFGLEQDQAGEMSKNLTDAPRLKEIRARLEKLEEQISRVLKGLRDDAARHMEETARNLWKTQQSLADKYRVMQEEQKSLVASLGAEMMDYQQRLDDLKFQHDNLNRMKMEEQIAESSDSQRIAEMFDTPSVPTAANLPDWRWHFIPGASAGLLLALILSPWLASRRMPAKGPATAFPSQTVGSGG